MQPRRNYTHPQRYSEPTHPWTETRINAVQEPYYGPYQPQDPIAYAYPRPRRRARRLGCGCIPLLLLACPMLMLLALYFLFPSRTNILVLGIDYTDPNNAVARSDTIILTTINPLQPYVGMLSIPRDLWVSIPGFGENRINTAHFFAEAQQAGSGPALAMQTIRQNFGVDVDYYVRVRFESVRAIVNAMGGVTIDMPEPMAGYPAGRHHLNGNKALAFARSRAGADDFFRMEHGQLLVKSMIRQMLNPVTWPRLPAVALATLDSIDTNVPVWLWPRLGLALLRAGPDGIDSRTINRNMAQGIITDQGANVLLPNWNLINPVLMEMFGQ
ncbi:MAG: LCP family protein [Chloroflexi bacterium]|jgi:LCP family protein required for cell wall assembly|nr:LCP family protein [Chloroflexota bacterium]